jgi:hypothetical protein
MSEYVYSTRLGWEWHLLPVWEMYPVINFRQLPIRSSRISTAGSFTCQDRGDLDQGKLHDYAFAEIKLVL